MVKGDIYIVTENDRRFVGRIGQFLPIKSGNGGGTLMRVVDVEITDAEGNRVKEKRDYTVTGTKGHEWIEADLVKKNGLEEQIDYSYYDELVEKAAVALKAVGYSFG